MPEIARIARENGAVVIEDASHAIGSRFVADGTEYKIGGHPWADMTTFSFHPVKTMTTGEGGAIATNDDELAERCRLFRNHGMRKREEGGNPKAEWKALVGAFCAEDEIAEAPWLYAMNEIGYNYRITDLQCALGLSQLKKLDSFIARRQEIVTAYNSAFADIPHIRIPCQPSTKTAWHLYVLQIDFAKIGKLRTDVMTELKAGGIGTQVLYIPVHLQPYYRSKYGYAPGKCSKAESFYQGCLSLPLYPAMTAQDQSRAIECVREVIA